MTNCVPTLSRLLNKPLALSSAQIDLLRSVLAHHGPREPIASLPLAGGVYSLEEDNWWDNRVRLQRHGPVAVIPVSGVLVSGPGGYGWPYLSFYEDIRDELDKALNDPAIKVIALWIDSPGGEVSQCFELASHIYNARAKKPVVAIIYDCAASAAYALASATSTITAPDTGLVGSIGVILIHSEYSQALERAGVKTTVFRYGNHKAELLPCEELTNEAAARQQEIINQLGEKFVTAVSQYRSLDAETIKAQQAEVFLGQNGIVHGLVDAIMPPHEALNQLIADFS